MNTKRILLMLLLVLPFIASAKLDTATRNRFMKEADQAFKAGNYEAAQEKYLDIYTKNGDEAAEELLDKCKQCIDLLDEANTAARYGQYSEAIEKYRAIMELNPDDPNVPGLIANCESKIEVDESKVLAIASAKLDTVTRNRLMKEADQAFKAGNYEAAQEKYLNIYTKNGEAEELLDKCKQCIYLLDEANTAARDGQYSETIEKYNQVLILNPTDKNIPTLIAKYKQRLSEPKLQMAKQYYREGKYSEARDYLNEYTSLSGVTDTKLLTAITEGMVWLNEAKSAFDNNDYDLAKSYYDKLLAANPTDAVSLQAVAEINRLNQKVRTVYVKEPTEKSLRPIKNKFNIIFYSGFGRPVEIGCGIGFNVSYFNLGIDVGGMAFGESFIEDVTSGDSYISDRNLDKFVKIDDKTYAQGTLQLAVTPGVNLKYFCVGVGLGSMMTKECLITHTYHERNYVDVTNKSRFLIRPTISGCIPFDSDYSAGVIIMAGYNIVNGLSGLNQFILGFGFFI